MRVDLFCLMVLASVTACGSSFMPGEDAGRDASLSPADGSIDAGDTDAGASVDAGFTDDAGPGCVAWERARVRVLSARLLETTPVHPNRTARILIEVAQCPSDQTARIGASFELEGRGVLSYAEVWRREPDCAPSERVLRPFALRFSAAGTYEIRDDDYELLLEIEVVDAPEIACGASTDGCVADCDCETGEVCLSGSGLGGPFATCARPCEVDRDCRGDGVCVSADDGLAFVCERGLAECAEPERPCPEGFECVSGRCEPGFVLSGATRGRCLCDADCGDGLRCVSGRDGARRCEAVCLTNHDVWCQGPHSCVAGVDAPMGVCGWIGD